VTIKLWNRRGLGTRIAVVVIAGTLGPMAIFGWAGWMTFSELNQELLAERGLLGRTAAGHLEYVIKSDLEALQTLGASGLNGDDATSVLAERAAVRDAYLRSRVLEGVLLLGPDARIVWEEPPRLRETTPGVVGLPIVADVFRTGRPDVSALIDEPGAGKRVYLLVPLRGWDGRVSRVAAGRIDPESERFRSLLTPFRFGDRGSMDLVDARGVVIGTTDPSRRYIASDHGRFIEGLIRDRKGAVGTCHGCHDPTIVRGRVREVLAFTPLSVVPWGVAVRQPEDEAFGPLAVWHRRLVLLGSAVLALAVLFAWGAARSIRKPVAVLTAAAERIAAGDMAQAIPPLGDDEVGRLGRSLDRMRAALRDSLDAIGRANQELEQRVAERTSELERLYRELSEREQWRARFLGKVISVQEDERKRIARELHDETSQSLAALVMGLETMLATLPPGPARTRAEEARAIGIRALEELHRILFDLRPSVLDDLGLTSAIRWCAERHLEPLGVSVRCEFSGFERRLPADVETALFRVVQEAVTNIAKHAKAETVLIQCAGRPGAVTIEIEDDGRGFDPGSLATTRTTGTGLGLVGIRERVELLGGTVEIESAPGEGTRIALTVPVPSEDGHG
jgi:signal transduction histidine kinase